MYWTCFKSSSLSSLNMFLRSTPPAMEEPQMHLFLISITGLSISRNHRSCQLLNLCTPPVFSLFSHIMHQLSAATGVEISPSVTPTPLPSPPSHPNMARHNNRPIRLTLKQRSCRQIVTNIRTLSPIKKKRRKCIHNRLI